MADELRQVASSLDQRLTGSGFHGPHVWWHSGRTFQPPRARRGGRGAQVTRVRRRSPSFGGLLLVLLAFFAFSSMFGGYGFIWLGFPLLFFLLPFLFFRAVSRGFSWQSHLPEETEALDEDEWEPAPAGRPLTASDAREVRLQQACDQILTAYEAAPERAREFLTNPRETIETIRRTGLNLLGREHSLRSLAAREDDERLARERTRLSERVHSEADPVTRQRLQSALDALDHRRQQRASILRAANRLDAEVTRLIYTLEDMHTQMLRVGNADLQHEAGASEGLRHSVESLRDEMGALADALDDVSAVTAPLRASARRDELRPR